MKTIPVEASRLVPAELAKLAEAEPVLLTRKGRPVCAVVEVDDLAVEAWSLGNNPEFLAILEESRRRLREKGGRPLAEVRHRALPCEPRGTRRKDMTK